MTDKRPLIAVLVLLAVAGVALRLADVSAGGPLEAVVVEDSAHRTPAVGAVLASAEVLEAVQEHQIAWHVADPTDEGPDLDEVQWAIDAAKKHSLPVLVTRRGGRVSVQALGSPAQVARTLNDEG